MHGAPVPSLVFHVVLILLICWYVLPIELYLNTLEYEVYLENACFFLWIYL